MFHANKRDLCPIMFLFFPLENVRQSNANLWGQTKLKKLLPTSKNSMIKNRKTLVMATISTKTLSFSRL